MHTFEPAPPGHTPQSAQVESGRSIPAIATRLLAVDLMRGGVMLLMIVDHASLFFNAGRVSDDGAASWKAGAALPLAQFLTRFMTHLCAPTFLFLAGVSIAVSAQRKDAAAAPAWHTDRDLLVRGAFIAALDLLYMSTLANFLILQVLYAIGVSMMCMVAVRRLSDVAIMSLAGAWFVLGEAVTSLVWSPPTNASLFAALTVANYGDESMAVIYPFVPWLCFMALGYVFARRVLLDARMRPRAASLLVRAAGALLLLFVVVRGLNGYGNMFLPRDDGSLAQWLHVSKYPPSLTYAALQLALLALCLAGLLRLEARGLVVHRNHPVLVFGQTALFFYLMHFTLLGVAGPALGLGRGELPRVFAFAGCALVLLYPACLGFRALKQRYPRSLLRYV